LAKQAPGDAVWVRWRTDSLAEIFYASVFKEKHVTSEYLAEFQKRAELFLLKCEKGVAGIAKGLEDQGIESKS